MKPRATKTKDYMKSGVDIIKDRLSLYVELVLRVLKDDIFKYDLTNGGKAVDIRYDLEKNCLKPLQSAITLDQLQNICEKTIAFLTEADTTIEGYSGRYYHYRCKLSLISLAIRDAVNGNDVGVYMRITEDKIIDKYTDTLEFIDKQIGSLMNQLSACIDYNKDQNDLVYTQAYGMKQLAIAILQITKQERKDKTSHDVNKATLLHIGGIVNEAMSILRKPLKELSKLNTHYPILKEIVTEILDRCREMLKEYDYFTNNKK